MASTAVFDRRAGRPISRVWPEPSEDHLAAILDDDLQRLMGSAWEMHRLTSRHSETSEQVRPLLEVASLLLTRSRAWRKRLAVPARM